jgi:hypothetical protein
MKYLILLLFILLTIYKTEAQQLDFWHLKCDSVEYDRCGYVDENGMIKIPLGKYPECFTDTFKNYAIVLTAKDVFVAIDRDEKVLFTVYNYDNGPDYVSDGAFRIVDDNKMGFADTSGKIFIKPQYDFVFPFENGFALVNVGGGKEKSDPTDPDCEHYTWTGGLWGIIDKNGKYIKDLKYFCGWNQDTKRFELIGDSEKFEIIKGQIKKIE